MTGVFSIMRKEYLDAPAPDKHHINSLNCVGNKFKSRKLTYEFDFKEFHKKKLETFLQKFDDIQDTQRSHH